MTCSRLATADWRKSRRSGNQNACIEIGRAPGFVGIRDTKQRNGGAIAVDRAVFGAFLAAVKRH